nr:hypothetical protein [uncultured Draconibacterium sp.]
MKILVLLLMAGLIVTSCSKDDKEGTPRQMTDTFVFEGEIVGTKNVSGNYNLPLLTLAEVIGSEAANDLKSAELQIGECFVEVEGLGALQESLGETIVLKDFTVTIGNNNAVLLGDCKVEPATTTEFASDVELSTTKYIKIATDVFNALKSKRSVTVHVAFTPSHSIVETDDVMIKIGFGGVYNYVVYE